jgi:hypothetical protein
MILRASAHLRRLDLSPCSYTVVFTPRSMEGPEDGDRNLTDNRTFGTCALEQRQREGN